MPQFTSEKFGFGHNPSPDGPAAAEPDVAATGGYVHDYADPTGQDWRAHTFLSSGSFVVSSLSATPANNNIEYLVVGGGGAGGQGNSHGSAGGGAGGVRSNQPTVGPGGPTGGPTHADVAAYPITATTYPITVGYGGPGGNRYSSPGQPGYDGFFSQFGSPTSPTKIRAEGGGGGGTYQSDGYAGGCGGGGSGSPYPGGNNDGGDGNTLPGSPTTPVPQQGFPGGDGNGSSNYGGGGGGGAGSAGASVPTAFPSTVIAGEGGDGKESDISGTAYYYAGGGGGNGYRGNPTASATDPGTGGGAGGKGGGGGGQTQCDPTSVGEGGGEGRFVGQDGWSDWLGSPSPWVCTMGGAGGQTTGSGGGGGANIDISPYSPTHNAIKAQLSGGGAPGIVIVRYKVNSPGISAALATGGNISVFTDPGSPTGSTCIHAFTCPGEFTNTSGSPISTFEYFCIGGGGSGGCCASGIQGGGGGAGGVVTNVPGIMPATTAMPAIGPGAPNKLTVSIGQGGMACHGLAARGTSSGWSGDVDQPGFPGQNSTITGPGPWSVTAYGGGGGGGNSAVAPEYPVWSGPPTNNWLWPSVSFGSGGGGHESDGEGPTNHTAAQGFAGGDGNESNDVSGGGGGAGGAGIGPPAPNPTMGNGGIGVQLPARFRNPVMAGHLGTPGPDPGGFYVGGGGGTTFGYPQTNRAGGAGGGGDPYQQPGEDFIQDPQPGITDAQSFSGTPGQMGCGAGGGGGTGMYRQNSAGQGGTGVFIIAYPV